MYEVVAPYVPLIIQGTWVTIAVSLSSVTLAVVVWKGASPAKARVLPSAVR